MKGMERHGFEDEWKSAFDEVGISPSDGLWTNIELELEKADGDKMKRRILFYKLMAAASIAFAMCISGIGAYYYSQGSISQLSADSKDKNYSVAKINSAVNNSNLVLVPPVIGNVDSIATNKSSSTSNRESSIKLDQTSETAQKIGLVNSSNTTDRSSKYDTGVNQIVNNASTISQVSILTPVFASRISNDELIVISSEKLPPLVRLEKIVLKSQSNEPDPFVVMMAKLEKREQELMQVEKKREKGSKSKSRNSDERLWTSLGFAAGRFTAINSDVSPSHSTAKAALTTKETTLNLIKAPGTSYSVGVNLGTKIKARWILQGGVNYLAQNSTYEATYVKTRQNDTNGNVFLPGDGDTETGVENESVPTGAYNVNNNLQYLNVPLQAGYMAINRKFGIQVNAGVSTDLFLHNTTSAKTSNLDDGTANAAYRPVNFSGLVGTEISYRMGKHYRLALNPGLKYPINSVYKSSTGIESTPLTYDIGMKFRYIFN